MFAAASLLLAASAKAFSVTLNNLERSINVSDAQAGSSRHPSSVDLVEYPYKYFLLLSD
jgi:hypothetical protein